LRNGIKKWIIFRMSDDSRGQQRSRAGFRPTAPKLLDQVREVMRYHHYGRRTEEAYVSWIKQFVLFHHKTHPKDMGKQEIESFLSHLAVDRNVAVSTQNQAFNALLFLYKQVLNLSFADDISAIRAKKHRVYLWC